MKKFFCLFLVVFASGGYWVYLEKVDNFSCSDLYLTTWPKKEYRELSCRASRSEVQKILDQPFTYLTKGRQFYVFASHDGKYVLKFLKCQRVNFSDFYKAIPLPEFLDKSRRLRLQQKMARVSNIFASCALSAEKLYHGTGVLFVHLSSHPELQKEVTLIDGAGFSHRLMIDQVPFVVQLRAKPLFSTLDELIKAKDDEAIDRRLQQLVNLVLYDSEQRVMDIDDGAIENDNLGFLQDRAIHADIGTFFYNEKGLQKKELDRLFKRYEPIVEWLEKIDPKLAERFRLKIKRAEES